MTLTKPQMERLVELTFYEVIMNLKEAIPNEKFFLFLEAYCRVFGIDYTSISQAYLTLKSKIAPSKKELRIFQILTGKPVRSLGMDFRTITKYRKEIEQNKFDFFPRIMNRFINEDMKAFVIAYTKMFPAEFTHLHTYILEGNLGE